MQSALVVRMRLVCWCIAATFGGMVSAVEGGTPRATGTDAEPARLDPVVVTGTQVAVPLSELPSAVTVITREEINSRQVTDVPQLLRTVPGLGVVETGGRGSLTAVLPRGGEADYNMVLVDGVQVNDVGGAYDFSDLTTDNIERIEIIRGPQSALYGSNAIGSVIQIFTRRGQGTPQGNLSLSGGNFNTFEGHGGVTGGIERFGGSLGVGYVSTSGFLPINNAYTNFTISSALDYQPIEALKLAFSARFTDSFFEIPTEGAGDRLSPLDPDQYSERQRLVLSLQTTHAITPWWEQILLLGYNRIDFQFVDNDNGPPNDFGNFFSDSLQQRLLLNYYWNMSLPEFYQVATTWTLGIEALEEKLEQISTFVSANSDTTTNTTDPSRSQQGYYTQFLLNWRQQATLLAGVRVEDSSTFGVDPNPRASASYTFPWTLTKLRGGYATGIRAPSFVENFGDGSPFVVGNPNLEPEESSSWELGVDQPLFDQRVLISATYFNNRYRNLIAFVSGPGVSFENVGKAESSGVEAGIQALLPWQLRFDGSYTFLETKVLQDGGIGGTAFPVGQPLLRRPKNQGSAALTYLGGRWTAAVIANMVDSSLDRDFTQPGSPRVTVPGFIILGLAGSYTALENVWQMRSLRLQLKIDNLLDKDYEQVYGFSQPGFSVRGGVMVNF